MRHNSQEQDIMMLGRIRVFTVEDMRSPTSSKVCGHPRHWLERVKQYKQITTCYTETINHRSDFKLRGKIYFHIGRRLGFRIGFYFFAQGEKQKISRCIRSNTIRAGWNKQLEAGTVSLVTEFLFQYDISPLLPQICHADVRHEISCCF